MKKIIDDFFDFKKNKIHYVFSGKGKPVVILPSGVNNSNIYKELMERLVKLGFAVYIIDFPGRGKTVYTGQKCSLNICAQILKKFLKIKNFNLSAIIGVSYGGMVLVEFLHSNPDFLGKVIFLQTGRPFSKMIKKIFKAALVPAQKWKKIRRFYQRFLAKIWDKDMADIREDQYQVLLDCWQDLVSWPLNVNYNFAGEILSIIGWKDMVIDEPITKEVFPKAKVDLKLLPKARHNNFFKFLEKDDYKMIVDFLKQDS